MSDYDTQSHGMLSHVMTRLKHPRAKPSPLHVVVFTGGEFPAPEKTRPFWESPLAFGAARKPDFIVAADSGIETLQIYRDYFSCEDSFFCDAESRAKLDFSPDLIVGDFDSVSGMDILSRYPDEIIERSPVHKDLTDTELAMVAARGRFKHVFVTLVGGAGGRPDHFLGIFDLFGGTRSPDAWLCGEQLLLDARRRKFIVENLDVGSPISVARASRQFRGGTVSTRGLEWESRVFRKRGMPSISNTISLAHFKEKRPVEFCFKRGSFVLVLPISSRISISRI